MTAPGVLPPQPWMAAVATRRLVAALGAGGTEIRFVGGCVRDALIGRATDDIDLATPDPPDIVTRKLEAAGLRAIPTGVEHGTITALVDDRRYEITTLRRDVATDGRHAEVAFTDDWQEDAARRDFTINALSATPDGELHDYFGGLADLEAGRVVFVGEPARRIAEDYLRVLRFYRFHAWFGRGAFDAGARAACRGAVDGLGRLSGERVRVELLKLLAAPEPAATIRAMIEDRVLPSVSAVLSDVTTLAALIALEPAERRDRFRRLAALIAADVDVAAVAALAERLRLSGNERERLLETRRALDEAANQGDERALRRAQHRRGTSAVVDRLLLDAARRGGCVGIGETLAFLTDSVPPRFPLRGNDVMELGVSPGPRVGVLLAAVETWWIEADFAPDRAACLRELAARVRAAT